MESLSTGVIICTYNGVKYLSEQLESILHQTHTVDHIVISDDGSKDGTWDLLQAWAGQAGVPVTLMRNAEQLGVSKNFERAVQVLKTELIITSDQDDIWLPNKVQSMRRIFEDQPDVLFAHSDSVLIDAHGAELGTTFFETLQVSKHERDAIHAGNALDVLVRRNIVSGATAIFRRKLLELAGPTANHYFPDEWLAIVAAALGKIVLLEKPTIKYRQHQTNMVGARKTGPVMQLRQLWWAINGPRPLKVTIDKLISKRSALNSHLAAIPGVSKRRLELCSGALAFAKLRGSLPKNPIIRLLKICTILASRKYGRYSYEPRSDVLRDILSR